MTESFPSKTENTSCVNLWKRMCTKSECVFYLDINECANNKGGCQYACRNTMGSYACWCQVGDTLDSDMKSCTKKGKVHKCPPKIVHLPVKINPIM